MFRIFQAVLYKFFGVELQRAPKAQTTRKVVKTKAYHIEFMGVSGVGKSHLYKAIKKLNSDKWMSAVEFRNRNMDKFDKSLLVENAIYQKLAEYRINPPNKNQDDYRSPLVLLFMAQVFFNSILKDYLIAEYNKDYTVISPDGLTHNFIRELFEMEKNDNELFLEYFKNRAVVHVTAPSSQIIEQILDRHGKKDRLPPQYMNKSREKILEIVEDHSSKMEGAIKILKDIGVPVLRLDNSEDLSNNIDKIQAFISELQQ